MVTAGGLLFIGATNFDKKFRAFDKSTGKLLWETVLPAAANATPATYEVNGWQYVVVAAGGGKSECFDWRSYVAFALPETTSRQIGTQDQSINRCRVAANSVGKETMRRRDFIYTLALSGLAPLAGDLRAQPDKMRVVLDTDIGDDIDDAWALAFMISHQRFTPLGVTITHGNTPARAKIACKFLHVTNRDGIPVHVGRKTNDKVFPQYSWAEDFTAKQPASNSAADFIVETVKRYPGEVTLMAVGPLQNVADALRREPNLAKYVKRVVLMSGCVYGTSYSPDKPIREWNVYQSTADSQLVYGAGLPLTIVPLDSTTHVKLSDAERKQVRPCLPDGICAPNAFIVYG